MEKPTFKFESTIDLSNQEMAKALVHFIGTISGIAVATEIDWENTIQKTKSSETKSPETKSSETKNSEAKKPVKSESPKVPKTEKQESPEPETEIQKKEEVEKEEEDTTENTKPGDGSDDEISFDLIRTELAKKVGEHKVVIKNKMTELGAKNISSLKEEDYSEFYKFLIDL